MEIIRKSKSIFKIKGKKHDKRQEEWQVDIHEQSCIVDDV